MQRMEEELRVISLLGSFFFFLSDVRVAVIKMFSRLELLQFPFLPFPQLHPETSTEQRLKSCSASLTR